MIVCRGNLMVKLELDLRSPFLFASFLSSVRSAVKPSINQALRQVPHIRDILLHCFQIPSKIIHNSHHFHYFLHVFSIAVIFLQRLSILHFSSISGTTFIFFPLFSCLFFSLMKYYIFWSYARTRTSSSLTLRPRLSCWKLTPSSSMRRRPCGSARERN